MLGTGKNSKIRIRRKKFHWWQIPLGIFVLAIVAVGGLLGYMHTMLPWRNILAMTSNFKLNLPEKIYNFATGGERDLSTLPDVLTMEDQTAVKEEKQFEERREEILELYKENVYGYLPESGYETTFEVLEEGEALGGTAIRRQIKITVTTDKGSSDALMLLYIPNAKGKYPVILGLNSNGNQQTIDDDQVLMSYAYDISEKTEDELEELRGDKSYRWNIENNIARGYATATIYFQDFAPDSKDTYQNRIISLFDDVDEFSAIGAWAFGLSRGVDYLETDSAIDAEHIAVIGHSRLGKAAIWAGANDERIGLVISNDSGEAGASLSRANHGETVKSIYAFFPYWFSSNYKQYGGKEETLPVDSNLLLASIAPRQIYVAAAEDDLWSDPEGAWLGLINSTEAFRLYNKEVIEETEMPATGTHIYTESMGFHIRSGWHEMQEEDWENYLDYMDTYFTEK